MFGTNLTWETEHWTTRVVYQQTKFASSIATIDPLVQGLSALPPGLWPEASELAGELDAENKSMRYYGLGVSYDNSPWVTQAELGYIDSGYEAAFPDLFTAYLSVGHRFDSVTLFGVGAIAKNTGDTLVVPTEPSMGTIPILTGLEQGLQAFADTTGIDQHTFSLGMRWDLRHDLALKAQWDRTWVKALGGALWDQKEPNRDDRTIDTFSINLNFVF